MAPRQRAKAKFFLNETNDISDNENVQFRFYTVLFLASAHLHVIAASENYTVCTATINSSEERETFKKYLGKQNFKFVELTDFDKGTTKDERSSNWFKKACEAKVQCDVLMISGHFGGSFFGDKGYSLEMDTLEKQSCEKTCEGILKRPKEVFLMGCNTLASKGQDHRTPEQYLQVLLNDGINRQEAERIVQSRYGALGSSFKDRMRRVFSGIPAVYGFDSVGPSGKTVKPFLDKYFQKIPNYNEHLKKIESERLNKIIDFSNKAASNINNTILAEVLKPTAFTQCSGLTENDPSYVFKSKICQLYDSKKTLSQKVEIARNMLKGENRLELLPSVAAFFDENKGDFIDEEYLDEIRKDLGLRNEIEKLLKTYSSSPGIQMDLIAMMSSIKWIDQKEYAARQKEILSPLIKNLNRENVDLICSLENGIVEVGYDDFTASQLRTTIAAEALACMITEDKRVANEVLQGYAKMQASQLAIAGVSQLPANDSEKYKIALMYEKSRNAEIAYEALKLKLRSAPSTSIKIETLRDLLKHEDGFYDVTSFSYSHPSVKDDLLADRLLKISKSKSDNSSQALSAAIRLAPLDSSNIWKEIIAQADQSKEKSNAVLEAIAMLGSNKNSTITDWAFKKFVSQNSEIAAYLLERSHLDQSQIKSMLESIHQSPSSLRSKRLGCILVKNSELSASTEQTKQISEIKSQNQCK